MVWVAGEDGQCWWWNKQSCASPFGSVGTQLQLQEGWGYLLFPSAVGHAGGLGLAGPWAHNIQVPFPARHITGSPIHLNELETSTVGALGVISVALYSLPFSLCMCILCADFFILQ